MDGRAFVRLVLLCLLAVTVGCREKVAAPRVLPTHTPSPAIPSMTPSRLEPSSTPTQIMPSATPSPTEQPLPTPTSTGCTALLGPPHGLEATFVDLVWDWAGLLEADQWFEVRIRLDQPGDPPVIYYWVWEPWLRITSSMLEPGRYRWHVCVVRGDGEPPGTEPMCTLPEAQERIFVLTGPLTQATMSVTPTPSSTLTPSTTPTPCRVWWPSATPTVTPTCTVTATVSSTPTPSATASSTPTCTSTPSATASSTPTYTPTASVTASPTSSQTPTNTPSPTETATPVPTVPEPTVPEPSVTPTV